MRVSIGPHVRARKGGGAYLPRDREHEDGAATCALHQQIVLVCRQRIANRGPGYEKPPPPFGWPALEWARAECACGAKDWCNAGGARSACASTPRRSGLYACRASAANRNAIVLLSCDLSLLILTGSQAVVASIEHIVNSYSDRFKWSIQYFSICTRHDWDAGDATYTLSGSPPILGDDQQIQLMRTVWTFTSKNHPAAPSERWTTAK
eukprot:IDg16331t1